MRANKNTLQIALVVVVFGVAATVAAVTVFLTVRFEFLHSN